MLVAISASASDRCQTAISQYLFTQQVSITFELALTPQLQSIQSDMQDSELFDRSGKLLPAHLRAVANKKEIEDAMFSMVNTFTVLATGARVAWLQVPEDAVSATEGRNKRRCWARGQRPQEATQHLY